MTIPPEPAGSNSIWLQRMLKPWQMVATLALLLLVATVVIFKLSPSGVAVVVLDYDNSTRSTTPMDAAQLVLTDSVAKVQFRARIPHSALFGTSYELTILDPAGNPVVTGRTDSITAENPEQDWVFITVPAEGFQHLEGPLRAAIRELLPPEAELEPEAYDYLFIVSRPK